MSYFFLRNPYLMTIYLLVKITDDFCLKTFDTLHLYLSNYTSKYNLKKKYFLILNIVLIFLLKPQTNAYQMGKSSTLATYQSATKGFPAWRGQTWNLLTLMGTKDS